MTPILDVYMKALTVVKAWLAMRPTKTFFRMSLEDFQKTVAASGDARARIAQLEADLRAEVTRRDDADKITRRTVLRVVNAVKGDPDEGEDGELLAAMGYVPHTARSSIISMGRKAKAAQKATSTGEDQG
jgi:hypothetical protein